MSINTADHPDLNFMITEFYICSLLKFENNNNV